jgi:gluconate:H+ symporter, GntP family
MPPLLTVLADDLVEPVAPGWQLITATLVGIALLILLITIVKLNPFLALILGGLTVGAIAGENLTDVITSFTTGLGTTVASVGVLIALGAIFAKLLAESGGADQVVDTIVGHASGRALPWSMAAVGAIIGLPMFFEIGLVLLMPVIYLVARRAQVSLITVGIPALAGLSAMHGFVPPHPGPVVAIGLLHANLGVTLGLGILVAIPTIIVAGPLYGTIAGRWVVLEAPTTFDPGADHERVAGDRRPSFAATIATILLPVVLMLAKAVADIVIDDPEDEVQKVFDVIGNPFIALLIGVLVAMVTFGVRVGMDRDVLSETVSAALPPIAGILLIVAAGGGFKQVLVDSGVGTLLANWAQDANVSVLLLSWVLAVLIRLATGSATIATITASSLVVDLVAGMSTGEVSLVVLAVGAGSLFFSHVNDAGFWLVNQYFGMSVGQTIKSWSIMETVLSVTGLVLVLILGIFI